MKIIFLLAFISFSLISPAQIPKSGTYIYKYCDLEYHECISTCKVVIRGNHITIYATKELAQHINSFKQGDIIDKGIILKHKSGEWIIGKSRKDINANEIGGCSDGPREIDFKRKRFWTC